MDSQCGVKNWKANKCEKVKFTSGHNGPQGSGCLHGLLEPLSRVLWTTCQDWIWSASLVTHPHAWSCPMKEPSPGLQCSRLSRALRFQPTPCCFLSISARDVHGYKLNRLFPKHTRTSAVQTNETDKNKRLVLLSEKCQRALSKFTWVWWAQA